MGLLDAVRAKVSSVVNTVEQKVTQTVEKVEARAVDVAQSAKSAFESKPAPPPPAPSAPVSSNPSVSARSVALNPALLRNELSVASGSPKDAADALIKKHTAFYGNLYEENLGDELADMARKDPTRAAATINAVSQKLSDGDMEDVAKRMAMLSPDDLRKLAYTPDGEAALRRVQSQLGFPANVKVGEAIEDAKRPKFSNERCTALGKLTYANNGDKSFNLNDPQQVKQLVANTPQLDDLDGTRTDQTRCAGASMLNGMMLSGDPAKNAQAIENVANQQQVPISPEQTRALAAMKGGNLNGHQAAHLQELLLTVASKPRDTDEKRTLMGRSGAALKNPNGSAFPFERSNKQGVSLLGLSDTVKALRAEGAFANAKEISFRSESNHWQVAVTTKDGATTNANSWPDEKGQTTVGPPLGRTGTYQEFVLKNLDGDQVQVELRSAIKSQADGSQMHFKDGQSQPFPAKSDKDVIDLISRMMPLELVP